ncbi:hypothetical protein O181_024478 [Austropuccinia psidii MF-1]|uniref:Uncharacterized protein n=1 Tax=Austropuccinia psidii MF-1 TaxID=1389203 RepID=A0A9Q3GY92_9BASI|nr:hypothetical protein [Austropuccinia psidii MF-1]
MEATIKFNQMDAEREKARPGPDLESLPQERHVVRMPELPPFPKGWTISSGSHRNIPVQVQNLVKIRQGRGVGNMPKPLEGGHELLLTHQELSGSGEYHRALGRMEPIVLQRQGQKDEKLVEEPNSFIHRPEEGVGNDPSFGERRSSSINQLHTSCRGVQGKSQKDLRRSIEVPRTINEREKA